MILPRSRWPQPYDAHDLLCAGCELDYRRACNYGITGCQLIFAINLLPMEYSNLRGKLPVTGIGKS